MNNPYSIPVAGYCPMGCGRTLALDGPRISCIEPECPRPTAVDELLQDQETEHVVDFQEDGYTTRHPLRERLGDLFDCRLHQELGEQLDGPPGGEGGRYRVTRREHDGHSVSFRSGAVGFDFEKLS